MTDGIGLACEFLHDRAVNFAMQQNHVPVIKRLHITNTNNFVLKHLKVRITAEPAFAAVWEMDLALIPPGQTVDLGVVDLQLAPIFLAGLTERIEGRLLVDIFKNGTLVYSRPSPIAVLAYDQWSGTQGIPEMIAAFVTPNHPEIFRILGQAADILRKWTGSPSLDGYQSKDPAKVRKQLAAIFAALQQQNITYCVPPASFEEQGQKIRTPDVIEKFHLATCLDLTVLFAACVEAAGLNPLIIFVKEHAFPGIWLAAESFAESLQDDVTLLTKRIAPGVEEICVVESTAITAGQSSSFEQAVTMGENLLRNGDNFIFFVDVRRARASQIRPLPLRLDAGVTAAGKTPPQEIPKDQQAPQGIDWPVVIIPEDKFVTVETQEDTGTGWEKETQRDETLEDKTLQDKIQEEQTRLEQWERRLLDLSMRNPLLNFRVTGTCIPILTVELDELEDHLAEGEDFKIHPRPVEWDGGSRDARIFVRREKNDPLVQLLQEEFSQQRLRADLTERDLSYRLTQIYRAARISLEENGANTLFMALGLLVWYEFEASQKPRYAPIILLPMEIVRKSVQTGYVVRQGEDEPQLNITLVELLKQDFGIDISGLNPLPTDEHGIDVQRVFTVIRQAVMNKARWDVMENAYLGLFSFSKFVMWHDLKARRTDLKRNKIVSSLISGYLQWTPAGCSLDEEKFDEAYHPREIICPVSADSSQLAAICAAGEGRSIVLHGPPGTGKSQTITNIIAHVLAQGKSVLFVAEKMAALTVVQRRLEQIGLASFCLEVHSNKSKKKDILEQLQESLQIGRIAGPQEWLAEADRLAALREDLNKYVQALHRRRAIGHSFFHGLAQSVAVRQSPAVVSFKPEQVADLNPEKLQLWLALAHRLRVAGAGCGHPCGHVWSLSLCRDYLPQLRAQLADALATLDKAINSLLAARTSLVRFFALEEKEQSYHAAVKLYELAQQFVNTPPVPGMMVGVNDWDETRAAVDSWISHGRNRNKLRDEVYSRYHEQVSKLDATGMQENLRLVNQQWFIPRFFGQRRISKILRGGLKPGMVLAVDQIENDLDLIGKFQEEENFLVLAGDQAREMIGSLWQEGNADWDLVANACAWAANLRKLAVEIAGTDMAYLLRLRESWAGAVAECRKQPGSEGAPGGTYSKQLIAYINAYQAFAVAWQAFIQLAALDQQVLSGLEKDHNWFEKLGSQVRRWEDNLDGLRSWCVWQRVRAEAGHEGLEPLIKAYEAGELAHDQVEPAFQRGFYQTWIENELAGDQVLSSFSRSLFEDKIQQFRELDDSFARLTQQEVYARLAARLPQTDGDSMQTSEMGILQREILKQRRHMALRQLFSQIPNLLTRLKPCLLMSPISVAQYLDPAHALFDLVIFDEASQIPTCDAVGAIARGREAVIVGDPKQLPPTSFFMTGNTADDDEGLAMADLESILEDCLAISMPEEHLRWHYRSRHESLISFSNYQYYGSSLFTFPSPDDLLSSVKITYVDGFYDRGKSKQNRAEAEAVVAEVERRLLDPDLCSSSIGVVTFNQAQQRLIEDLLDERIRQNPALEDYFNSAVEEPVFVKNLENVQGDERDVILFSVGYGPDAQGRITYNFGPLNQEGGWRRLNVAITRARQEMLIFSTLRPEQMDLSRTNARGVADLKAFLEYAERGRQALLAQTTSTAGAEHDSLFEEQVGLALKERGHQVQAQVGASGYRIDLAIVDPDCPGRYLLGIECDGATYHRSKTARDRDKLREMVLRRLGWQIHRIWSTDWWENPQREIDLVEEAVAVARTTRLTRAAVAAGDESRTSLTKKTTIIPVKAPTKMYARSATGLGPVEKSKPSTAPGPNSKPYQLCRLAPVDGLREEFYLSSADELVAGQVMQVVNEEGPISHNLLCRRVIQAWGITRVGNRISERIRGICLDRQLAVATLGDIRYYWPDQVMPAQYTSFRVPGRDSQTRRTIEDIPNEEIRNAALYVLRQQISLPEDDLVREIARLFGHQRPGASGQEHFLKGIGLLIQTGAAKQDENNRVVLVG